MPNRLQVLKEGIEIAHSRDDGLHLFTRFVFDTVTGSKEFFTEAERREIGLRARGHMTGTPQIVSWERKPGVKHRYVVSDRSDGLFSLVVTDENPGGTIRYYHITPLKLNQEALDTMMFSPFVNSMLEIVLDRPE